MFVSSSCILPSNLGISCPSKSFSSQFTYNARLQRSLFEHITVDAFVEVTSVCGSMTRV